MTVSAENGQQLLPEGLNSGWSAWQIGWTATLGGRGRLAALGVAVATWFRDRSSGKGGPRPCPSVRRPRLPHGGGDQLGQAEQDQPDRDRFGPCQGVASAAPGLSAWLLAGRAAVPTKGWATITTLLQIAAGRPVAIEP